MQSRGKGPPDVQEEERSRGIPRAEGQPVRLQHGWPGEEGQESQEAGRQKTTLQDPGLVPDFRFQGKCKRRLLKGPQQGMIAGV